MARTCKDPELKVYSPVTDPTHVLLVHWQGLVEVCMASCGLEISDSVPCPM